MSNDTLVRFAGITFVRFKEGTESSLLTFPRASYIRDEWPYCLVAPMRCDAMRWMKPNERATDRSNRCTPHKGGPVALSSTRTCILIHRCIIRFRAVHNGKTRHGFRPTNSSRATSSFLLISYILISINSNQYKLK